MGQFLDDSERSCGIYLKHGYNLLNLLNIALTFKLLIIKNSSTSSKQFKSSTFRNMVALNILQNKHFYVQYVKYDLRTRLIYRPKGKN